MTKYFLPSSNQFFDSRLHSEIPKDAKKVTDDLYRSVMQQIGGNYILGSDDDGFPCVKVSDPPTHEELLSVVLAEVRELRETVLNAVIGIGFGAILSGDGELSSIAADTRQKLLDITDSENIRSAESQDGMRLAAKKEFLAIRDFAGTAFESAFRGAL